MFVLMAVIVVVVGGILRKYFYGRLPCESLLMLWGLGGEADVNLSAARRVQGRVSESGVEKILLSHKNP